MRIKIREMFKYMLSAIFFYASINYVRNVFLKPVFYDIFVRTQENWGKHCRAVVVIGPYYSLRGFLKSSCICTFSDGSVAVPSVIVDDPDKNCMTVLFNLPASVPDAFEYAVMRGKTKLFSGVYSSVQNFSKHKYGLSITTLFKYEAEYLREWIDYHRSVGVEHFYLYENNVIPDKKTAVILAPYVRDGLVTHILWPYPYGFYNYKLRKFWPNDALVYTQVPQINHALYKFSAETKWLLSCDIDEYFYSPKATEANARNLTEIIAAVNADHDVSSIRIQGFWFGGTTEEVAKVKNQTVGVLHAFIRSEKYPTSACKCILETATVRLASVHNSLVQENKEITVSPDILCFNHYRALGWKKRFDERFAREIENTAILKK